MSRLPSATAAQRMMRPLVATLAVLASAVACANESDLIGQDALLARLAAQDAGLVVLDVRTAEEFAEGHVPGASNVSHDELEARLGELAGARDKDIVIYCRSGRRADLAAETLAKAGFHRLYHLEGDFLGWSAAGREIQKPAAEAGPPD